MHKIEDMLVSARTRKFLININCPIKITTYIVAIYVLFTYVYCKVGVHICCTEGGVAINTGQELIRFKQSLMLSGL